MPPVGRRSVLRFATSEPSSARYSCSTAACLLFLGEISMPVADDGAPAMQTKASASFATSIAGETASTRTALADQNTKIPKIPKYQKSQTQQR